MNPYSIGNSFNTINDPYFQAALQSYNPNFQGMQAAAYGNAAAQTAQTAPSSADLQQMYPNGNTGLLTPQKEKKSNAGYVIGGILLTGAAIACAVAHKKGVGEGTITRIKDGFGKIFKSVGNKAGETFKVMQNSDKKWIAEIPGQKHSIKAAEASVYNISDKVSKLGEAGTEFRNAIIERNGWKYAIKNGKIVSGWQQATRGGAITARKTAEELASLNKAPDVIDIVKMLQNGKAAETASKYKNLAVHNIRFRDINNGAIRNLVTDGAGGTTISSIITNRFKLNDAAVKNFRLNNSTLDEALKTIEKGKIPENLNVAKATYNHNGTMLEFENGVLSKINNMKKGSNEFGAFLYDHGVDNIPQTISDLPRKAVLINPVYSL